MIAQYDDWMQDPVTIFTRKTPDKIPIYIHGRSTPIGHVAGGVFYKTIDGAKHILRKPRLALAFDRSTLRDAERAGAVSAQVTDTETGTVYICALADIWQHGFSVPWGIGDQVALALSRWSVNGRPVVTASENNEANKAAQPSLFGGGR